MGWELDEVPSLVASMGPEVVGRRYAVRLREHLQAMYAGREFSPAELDADPEGWIDDAVQFGDGVDFETRFTMILAAIDTAVDDGELWCIGDMPVSHLVGDAAFTRRFHEARKSSANTERMFRIMQHYYLDTRGESAGWWADDWRG